MEAKKEDPVLLEGERIIFSSKRGGQPGYSAFQWLLLIFVGMHVLGLFTTIPIALGSSEGLGAFTVVSLLEAVVVVGLGVRWYFRWKKPAYFITNKRVIVKRFLFPTLYFDLENIGAARRFMIRYTRYGAVVREELTHSVVLGFHSGGARRFGPVERVEEMMEILSGMLQGALQPAALPGENGEPSEAETREDLFFAPATLTGGVRRGPLFVGPTKIIAFASELPRTRLYQMLTMARKASSPSNVEASMLSFANNVEFGRGNSVVMEREGLTLWADEATFRVGSDDKAVAFDLFPRDGKRLARYVNDQGPHPYRG
jgi:hypothetical protein